MPAPRHTTFDVCIHLERVRRNTNLPSSEHNSASHPLQLYAATKRANELMAHIYSYRFGRPTTGLRFFTVYGPWGRPDVAFFEFTRAILAGGPIKVFNHGCHTRDFTYINDIVEGIVRASDRAPLPDVHWNGNVPDTATSSGPYRILNIGNGSPVALLDYIAAIESAAGKSAVRQNLHLQPGDTLDTHAEIAELAASTGYVPQTPYTEGIRLFVDWFREFYDL